MLGMIEPPQVVPSVQPPPSQHPQQSAHPLQQPNIQATQALPGQVGLQNQTSASQTQTSIRKPHQNQPAMPISSASVPAVNLQSQPMTSAKGTSESPDNNASSTVISTFKHVSNSSSFCCTTTFVSSIPNACCLRPVATITAVNRTSSYAAAITTATTA